MKEHARVSDASNGHRSPFGPVRTQPLEPPLEHCGFILEPRMLCLTDELRYRHHSSWDHVVGDEIVLQLKSSVGKPNIDGESGTPMARPRRANPLRRVIWPDGGPADTSDTPSARRTTDKIDRHIVS